MTRELSRTEKALRLIAKEGITAKEAAERVGISPAAVSKGRLWPSKAAQNVRKLCEMENEIEFLRSELATLTRQRDLAVEALENCRLLAARHRKEEWAGHIMRFCKDAGLSGSPIRNDSIKESENNKAS